MYLNFVRIIPNLDQPQHHEMEKESENTNQITNYIVELLKREINLPVIKSETDLNEAQMNTFIRNSINIIKCEYIEKQKKVVMEFQKRFLLKFVLKF